MTETQPHLSSCVSTGTERARDVLELTQLEDGWAGPRAPPCLPWFQGAQGEKVKQLAGQGLELCLAWC